MDYISMFMQESPTIPAFQIPQFGRLADGIWVTKIFLRNICQ